MKTTNARSTLVLVTIGIGLALIVCRGVENTNGPDPRERIATYLRSLEITFSISGDSKVSDPADVTIERIADRIAKLDAVLKQYKANADSNSATLVCLNNLALMSTAKDQYALEHGNKYPTSISDLVPKYIKVTPVCPGGGTYELSNPDDNARCSIWSHAPLFFPHSGRSGSY